MPMTESEVQSFLTQFDQAREDFKTWPKWMQDAAVERVASFQMPPKDGVAVVHAPAQVFTDDEIHAFYEAWEFEEEDPGRLEFHSLVREIEHRVLERTAGVNPSHETQQEKQR